MSRNRRGGYTPPRGEMKMRMRHFAVMLLGIALAACGSSSKITKPIEQATEIGPVKFKVGEISDGSGKAVPSHILAALRGHLESQLTKRNLLAADASSERVVDVAIDITGYRMRSGVMRGMFGMMAGKDGMDSKITATAATDPTRVLGESTVSSYNIMAVGGEDDIPRMHAEEIAKFLAGELEKRQKK